MNTTGIHYFPGDWWDRPRRAQCGCLPRFMKLTKEVGDVTCPRCLKGLARATEAALVPFKGGMSLADIFKQAYSGTIKNMVYEGNTFMVKVRSKKTGA